MFLFDGSVWDVDRYNTPVLYSDLFILSSCPETNRRDFLHHVCRIFSCGSPVEGFCYFCLCVSSLHVSFYWTCGKICFNSWLLELFFDVERTKNVSLSCKSASIVTLVLSLTFCDLILQVTLYKCFYCFQVKQRHWYKQLFKEEFVLLI